MIEQEPLPSGTVRDQRLTERVGQWGHGSGGKVDTSAEQLLEDLSETCDHCGFMRMQHSQDGRATCPTYTN